MPRSRSRGRSPDPGGGDLRSPVPTAAATAVAIPSGGQCRGARALWWCQTAAARTARRHRRHASMRLVSSNSAAFLLTCSFRTLLKLPAGRHPSHSTHATAAGGQLMLRRRAWRSYVATCQHRSGAAAAVALRHERTAWRRSWSGSCSAPAQALRRCRRASVRQQQQGCKEAWRGRPPLPFCRAGTRPSVRKVL